MLIFRTSNVGDAEEVFAPASLIMKIRDILSSMDHQNAPNLSTSILVCHELRVTLRASKGEQAH